MNAEKKIKDLTNLINHHDYLYHHLNSPEISDTEYDEYFAKLVNLEAQYPQFKQKNSPTDRIGWKPMSDKTIKHLSKMYGMSNVFNAKELKVWLSTLKLTKVTGLYADVKADGVAVALGYFDGRLVNASLRGDGECGDDITQHAMRILNIPKVSHNTSKYEVRGEVIIAYPHFEELNKLREASGHAPYKTPRSAVMGLLTLQDNFLPMIANLQFLAYDSTISGYRKYSKMMSDLKHDYEFQTLDYVKATIDTVDKIEDFYNNYLNGVAQQEAFWWNNIPADGVVVKIDSIELQDKLGHTDKYPKFMRAWKFRDTAKHTVISDIFYQIGRSGVLTPVGIIEPTYINSVEIKKVQLYNEQYIINNNFYVGNLVEVTLRAGVKPHLIRCISTTSKTKKFIPLKRCPFCDHKIIATEGKKVCINSTCIGILNARFLHFSSRSGLYVKGLGTMILDKLLDLTNMLTLDELFDLDEESFINLLGRKVGTKIYANLWEQIKKVDIYRLIYAIGIIGLRKDALKAWVDYAKDNSSNNKEFINVLITSGKDVRVLRKIISQGGSRDAIMSHLTHHRSEMELINLLTLVNVIDETEKTQ